ncbi:MAG: NAD-dependent epimerase/dehydratase family protein [Phycisphaerales bacterium]|nr:NAD-dependent epimerase/dehydratase family protein [Phycisphaerales bacterium]
MADGPTTSPTATSGAARRRTVLITGAGGEIGHGLIDALHAEGGFDIVAMDLKELDGALRGRCAAAYTGDVTDAGALAKVFERHGFDVVHHLAALLSSSGERNPELAHAVNVQGTLNLLRLSNELARSRGRDVQFIFPSSIAVYGMPGLAAKSDIGAVHEDRCLNPITMYGVNKLACEHLGRYYADHYMRLSPDAPKGRVDFRCLRFPGIISAHTLPTGGTSDFAPEMIHAAAKGEPYACFVRPDTRIPFMTMPDAVRSLLTLAAAPKERLTTRVYNVGAFSPSAAEIADLVRAAFPAAEVSYKVTEARQAIVDSWPASVDDDHARRDWGWAPQHDLRAAFSEYLIPTIRKRYGA